MDPQKSSKIIKHQPDPGKCYLNIVRILKVKKEWYGKKHGFLQHCNMPGRICWPAFGTGHWLSAGSCRAGEKKAGRRTVGLAGQPQLGAKCSQKIQKISQVHEFFERPQDMFGTFWNILNPCSKIEIQEPSFFSGDVGRQHGPCGFKLLKKILKSLSSWYHGWGLVLAQCGSCVPKRCQATCFWG